MKIVNKKVDDLIPYENNPRYNDEAVEYVANSIKEFGFKVPIIVDKNNVIVAGHTRYKASLELGLEEVPTIVADDLSDEQIKAFRLADNKVGEKSSWNFELLDEELEELDNLGFDMSEFDFEKTIEEKVVEAKKEGNVEFSEVIGEEHNYIVLYFDNDVDWLQAQTLFDIKPVKCGSTRKDKEISENMNRIGIGRVLKGSEAINKILGVKNEDIN